MSCKVKVISERTVCLFCREQWCAPQLTQLVRDAGTCGRAATVPDIVCFVFHVCGRDHTMCVFSALCRGGSAAAGGQTCSSHQLPPVTSAPGPALHKHNSDRLQACTNTSTNTNNNTTTNMQTNKRVHTTTNTCTTNTSASSGHEEAKTQQTPTKAHIRKSFTSVQVLDLVQPLQEMEKSIITIFSNVNTIIPKVNKQGLPSFQILAQALQVFFQPGQPLVLPQWGQERHHPRSTHTPWQLSRDPTFGCNGAPGQCKQALLMVTPSNPLFSSFFLFKFRL